MARTVNSQEPSAMEIEICRDLPAAAGKAMRSKRILTLLTRLQERNLITFDPFEGTAELTDLGRAAGLGPEPTTTATRKI